MTSPRLTLKRPDALALIDALEAGSSHNKADLKNRAYSTNIVVRTDPNMTETVEFWAVGEHQKSITLVQVPCDFLGETTSTICPFSVPFRVFAALREALQSGADGKLTLHLSNDYQRTDDQLPTLRFHVKTFAHNRWDDVLEGHYTNHHKEDYPLLWVTYEKALSNTGFHTLKVESKSDWVALCKSKYQYFTSDAILLNEKTQYHVGSEDNYKYGLESKRLRKLTSESSHIQLKFKHNGKGNVHLSWQVNSVRSLQFSAIICPIVPRMKTNV